MASVCLQGDGGNNWRFHTYCLKIICSPNLAVFWRVRRVFLSRNPEFKQCFTLRTTRVKDWAWDYKYCHKCFASWKIEIDTWFVHMFWPNINDKKKCDLSDLCKLKLMYSCSFYFSCSFFALTSTPSSSPTSFLMISPWIIIPLLYHLKFTLPPTPLSCNIPYTLPPDPTLHPYPRPVLALPSLPLYPSFTEFPPGVPPTTPRSSCSLHPTPVWPSLYFTSVINLKFPWLLLYTLRIHFITL